MPLSLALRATAAAAAGAGARRGENTPPSDTRCFSLHGIMSARTSHPPCRRHHLLCSDLLGPASLLPNLVLP